MPGPSDTSTITAIFPTRNAPGELAQHGQQAREWLDCVGQVVIVDSSEPNAVDALHASWPEEVSPEVHTRPPGLYDAWNFGAERAHGDYCYYSTVGDTMTREGLLHLQQTAVEFSADVVISPPELRDGGQPAMVSWPIHHFVQELPSPRLLSNDEKILWFAGLLPQSLLGSSAANLYATAFLQKHPFPTDCGHAGDAAWACSWPEGTRVAVTPQVCSRFSLHAPRQPVGAEEHAAITLELQNRARHLTENTDPATASSRAFLQALFSLEQGRLAWLGALGREQKNASALSARITELEKALAECHRKSGLFGWLRR
jgi:hypothetical protein